MQSQGSTSSQPSFDSLSSSDSLLLSDSDPVEDDTDVFLTDGSSSSRGAAASGDRGSESPGSQWTCDGFTDKEEEEESAAAAAVAYRSAGANGSRAADVGPSQAAPPSQTPKSHGDVLFAQKCAELQGFVRPLLELLSGLKRGRFDRGLSSFQQSVAMDRIQRIVGVLQRPSSGEKYMNTLLQVEMMLKLWFPQIHTAPVSAASSVATSPVRSLQDTSGSTASHKHRDQRHIPVKKRRLSWTGADTPTLSPLLLRCPHIRGDEKKAKQDQDERDEPPPPLPLPPPPSLASDANQTSPDAARDSQLPEDTKGKDSGGEELGKLSNYKAGQSSEPSLTWVHVAPILSPRKSCPSHEGPVAAAAAAAAAAGNHENQPVAAVLPLGRRGSPATQDCVVSSTTPPKHATNLTTPARCQSQPQGEGETAAACQGQSPSAHVTHKPLPRASPSPLET